MEYKIGDIVTLYDDRQVKIIDILSDDIIHVSIDDNTEDIILIDDIVCIYNPNNKSDMTEFDTSKIFEFVALHDKLDDYCRKLFKFIYEKYMGLLEFEKYSSYECYEIIDHRHIAIRYYDRGYDIYNVNSIIIPIGYIYNNTVKDYIDQIFNDKLLKIHNKAIEEQKREEYADRREYERLKAKFGNN